MVKVVNPIKKCEKSKYGFTKTKRFVSASSPNISPGPGKYSYFS
jgi:hypothetical protein